MFYRFLLSPLSILLETARLLIVTAIQSVAARDKIEGRRLRLEPQLEEPTLPGHRGARGHRGVNLLLERLEIHPADKR